MAKPYFNEQQCVGFYQRFVQDGDRDALDALIAQSTHIVEYNAIKIAPGEPERIDDLIQIGLERVLDICHERKYTPGRGKLFPFLTTSTHNRMMDYLRFVEQHHLPWCPEAENVPSTMETPSADSSIVDGLRKQTCLYITRRFPSLRPEIAIEATEYLIDCLADGRCIDTTHAANGRVKRTLADVFGISKWHVALAVRAYMGLAIVGAECYEDYAIQVVMSNPRTEWSNIPETMLIMGPEMYGLMSKCLGHTSMRLTQLNGANGGSPAIQPQTHINGHNGHNNGSGVARIEEEHK